MNCFQHLSESRGATDKPPRGGATKKKADSTTPHALSASNTHAHHNQAHCTTALAHLPSLLTERATHAHPLHPAALAFVPYYIVLVRVDTAFAAVVVGMELTLSRFRDLKQEDGSVLPGLADNLTGSVGGHMGFTAGGPLREIPCIWPPLG